MDPRPRPRTVLTHTLSSLALIATHAETSLLQQTRIHRGTPTVCERSVTGHIYASEVTLSPDGTFTSVRPYQGLRAGLGILYGDPPALNGVVTPTDEMGQVSMVGVIPDTLVTDGTYRVVAFVDMYDRPPGTVLSGRPDGPPGDPTTQSFDQNDFTITGTALHISKPYPFPDCGQVTTIEATAPLEVRPITRTYIPVALSSDRSSTQPKQTPTPSPTPFFDQTPEIPTKAPGSRRLSPPRVIVTQTGGEWQTIYSPALTSSSTPLPLTVYVN